MAESKTKTDRSWVGFLFGLPFFAMGAGFMWFMGLKPITLSVQSLSWPQVACTVTHSELLSFSDSDGTSYRPEIRVRHFYQDQQYDGGNYNFNTASSSGRSGKAKIVSDYPVGRQTWCWVNPNNPYQAVISRSVPGLVWFVIPFTSVFVIIGLAIMLGSLGLFPKKWRVSRNHRRVTTDSAGLTELKPRVTRGGKLAGALAFMGFWNGIVSIFVYQAVQGFRQGDGEWFLVVFLIPFVLVGIGCVVFVVRQFLALFNPKPTLFISEGSPKLGEKVNLSWAIEGDVTKLSALTITLEGREKATYRVGTDTRTDTHCFYKHTLINIQDARNTLSRTVAFSVPMDSMHSFKSSNNEVEWQIVFCGEIPRWPNVEQDYRLVVRPL